MKLTLHKALPASMLDSIHRFKGENEAGDQVIIAVDHRPARELRAALAEGIEPEVWVESWQVLSVTPEG